MKNLNNISKGMFGSWVEVFGVDNDHVQSLCLQNNMTDSNVIIHNVAYFLGLGDRDYER